MAFPSRGALLTLLLTIATPAGAQVDETDRKAARVLGEEGSTLFASGDFKGALKKYEAAFKLVPVTTLGVRVARTLDKLGRLVEADAKYSEVLAMELPAGAPAVHQEAKEQAKKELEALRARLPGLIVDPEVSPGDGEVRVTLDGVVVPPAEWRKRRNVDPGSHKVVASRGGIEITKEVKVFEGDVAYVPLTVPPGVPRQEPAPSASVAAPPPPPPPATASTSPHAAAVDGSARRTAGYVALGVGGVGVLVSIYGYMGATSKQGNLDARCKGGACPPSAFDDLDAYESKKRLATMGVVVGALGGAVGGVLLFTDVGATRRTTGFVGPGSVGVRGSF